MSENGVDLWRRFLQRVRGGKRKVDYDNDDIVLEYRRQDSITALISGSSVTQIWYRFRLVLDSGVD